MCEIDTGNNFPHCYEAHMVSTAAETWAISIDMGACRPQYLGSLAAAICYKYFDYKRNPECLAIASAACPRLKWAEGGVRCGDSTAVSGRMGGIAKRTSS